VTLKGNGFLNDFTQSFQPGNVLSFTLNLTSNLEPHGFPDEFTFAILDSSGAELPTKSFANVFLSDAIGSPFGLQAFASDPNQAPHAGGAPLNIPAPTVQTAGAVPEPSSLLLLIAGLTGFLGLTGKKLLSQAWR
jgi:hypothetical protein